MAGDRPDELRQSQSGQPARAIAGMFRRAVPRVIAMLLLLAASSVSAVMTTGALASALRLVCFALLSLAAGGFQQWWRYVKFGKPTPWRVDHAGTTAFFVTDLGRNRFQVAAHLRQHSRLDFGEALKRADDPSRPVWDDLTSASTGVSTSRRDRTGGLRGGGIADPRAVFTVRRDTP